MFKMVTVFFLIILLSLNLRSTEYISHKTVRINSGDTLKTNLMASGRYVEVMGYVDADVFAGCEKTIIEGKVSDDVLSGCRELDIRGEVGDMVVGFGQTVLIDGKVGGDVIAFCGELRITDRAHIGGNLVLGTGKFVLNGGRIDGWIKGGSGEAYLDGQVGGSVDMEVGNVSFGEKYKAAGGTELTLSEETKKSETRKYPPGVKISFAEKSHFYQSGFFYWSFLAMLVTGVLIAVFFKTFTRKLVYFTEKRLLANTGMGLILLIAVPIAVIILLVLIVTIPAALIILAIYLIILYLSSIFSAFYVGTYGLHLLGQEKSSINLFLAVLMGLLLIVLLAQIPYIGWLVKLAAICLGTGNLISFLWNRRKEIPGGTGKAALG